MINQVGLRRRAEKNIQKRACSYCDLVLNGRRVHGGRRKIPLTQRRKTHLAMRQHQLTLQKRLFHDGEEVIDLRKYLSDGLRWGIGRNSSEEIIDLRQYLSDGLQWGVGRDVGEETVDLRRYLCGLRWGVHREIVAQDDAGEGAEKVAEEKASEVDDGDVMNQKISNSKPLNFDLNELPPPEERGDD